MLSTLSPPPLALLPCCAPSRSLSSYCCQEQNGAVHLGPVFGIRKPCCFLTGEKVDKTPLDFPRNFVWTLCYRGF
ncbi:hypothetical protein UPYG_G00240200 [Umbra pygmaea]|uniref:Secreted protein n=1 Tax=Umbra pygmaea TaxID=75934 RepID=A0ABD0WKG9_UMBPY